MNTATLILLILLLGSPGCVLTAKVGGRVNETPTYEVSINVQR